MLNETHKAGEYVVPVSDIEHLVIAVRHATDIAIGLMADAYGINDRLPDLAEAERAFYALYEVQEKAHKLHTTFFESSEKGLRAGVAA